MTVTVVDITAELGRTEAAQGRRLPQCAPAATDRPNPVQRHATEEEGQRRCSPPPTRTTQLPAPWCQTVRNAALTIQWRRGLRPGTVRSGEFSAHAQASILGQGLGQLHGGRCWRGVVAVRLDGGGAAGCVTEGRASAEVGSSPESTRRSTPQSWSPTIPTLNLLSSTPEPKCP